MIRDKSHLKDDIEVFRFEIEEGEFFFLECFEFRKGDNSVNSQYFNGFCGKFALF